MAMKINKLGTAQTPIITERDMGAKTEKTSGHFASDLMKQQDGQTRERLNALLEEIENQ